MGNLDISPTVASEEQAIQQQINEAINSNKSIVFEAGAGAGKTYALVESLKHIVQTQGDRLLKNQQKVTCITYTNVAANEINTRLGQSEITQVSTIHERLWNIVKPYQTELVKLHCEKLKREVQEIQLILDATGEAQSQNDKFGVYYSTSNKEGVKQYLIEHQVDFNRVKNANAPTVKDHFKKGVLDFGFNLTNVSNFKKIANTIITQSKYEKVIEAITNKEKGFTKVLYSSTSNIESIAKMRISHDSLIEYTCELVEQNDLLKRLIIDTSPYFLVDEYQDTSPLVVTAVNAIAQYASNNNLPWFVGYFGDRFQNIYNDGIGSDLQCKHLGLHEINKKFNRRSIDQVITLGNGIKQFKNSSKVNLQESIFQNNKGPEIVFYHCQSSVSADARVNAIEKFIDLQRTQWRLVKENQIDCLVLLNKTMAKLSHFEHFYSAFEALTDYRNMKTALLNKDVDKLAPLAGFINRLMLFRFLCVTNETALIQIGKREHLNKTTVLALQHFVKRVRKIKADTLMKYLQAIFEILDQIDDKNRKVFKRLVFDEFFKGESIDCVDDVISWSYDTYNWRLNGHDESEELLEKIHSIYQVSFTECVNWFEFVGNHSVGGNFYHTFHGTKGAEYKNVVIVLESDFGRTNRRKFSNFLTQEPDNVDDFENTRNLLYVACTRAKQNLAVLYLDDFAEIEQSVEQLFNEVKVISDA